jgi:hypothetical protein
MPCEVILKNISRFISLDKTEADYFVSLLQSKKIKKNGFLLKPGEICRYENFITNGCMRTYTIDNNGFEHILMFGIEDCPATTHKPKSFIYRRAALFALY